MFLAIPMGGLLSLTFYSTYSTIGKYECKKNTFDIGWQEYARRVFEFGRHVLAAWLHNTTCAPANLQQALASNNPDSKIWNELYNEEYDGLDNLKVFTEITAKKYKEYLVKYGEESQIHSNNELIFN